jgi:hypothetical protein
MVKTGKKYVSVLPAKLILLLVLIAVFLLGYTTAAQAADEDAKGLDKIKNNTFLDPFTLTSISYSTDMTYSSSRKGPWNPRALLMIPYRGPKRSPVKPPWLP